jgi:protein-disulfide isomerase
MAHQRRHSKIEFTPKLAVFLTLVSFALACQLSAPTPTPTRHPTRTPKPTSALTPTPTIPVVLPEPYSYPNPNGRELGDPHAPVVMEVYVDFQCPPCGKFASNDQRKIIEQYVATGKVRLIFRHFPFIGDESYQAALASMCAAEQNRFWEYGDLLFANLTGKNEGAFSGIRLENFADVLGLDLAAFSNCLETRRYEEDVNSDHALGQSLGVTAVTSVFIDGQPVMLGQAPNFETIQATLEAALAGK